MHQLRYPIRRPVVLFFLIWSTDPGIAILLRIEAILELCCPLELNSWLLPSNDSHLLTYSWRNFFHIFPSVILSLPQSFSSLLMSLYQQPHDYIFLSTISLDSSKPKISHIATRADSPFTRTASRLVPVKDLTIAQLPSMPMVIDISIPSTIRTKLSLPSSR